MIELLIVVAIIGIIAAIAIPNLLASRRSANEGSAIASMRTINSAQATYQSTAGNGSFAADMAALRTANIIDTQLGSGTKSGYTFTTAGIAATSAIPALYNANAVPTTSSGLTATGIRAFYTNESGVIYASANATPPAATSATDRTVTGGSPLN